MAEHAHKLMSLLLCALVSWTLMTTQSHEVKIVRLETIQVSLEKTLTKDISEIKATTSQLLAFHLHNGGN